MSEIPKAKFTMEMILKHECLRPYVSRLQLPEEKFVFLVEAIADLNVLIHREEGLAEIKMVEGVLLLCAKVAEKEREACAKIAEENPNPYWDCCTGIAEKIRARGEK